MEQDNLFRKFLKNEFTWLGAVLVGGWFFVQTVILPIQYDTLQLTEINSTINTYTSNMQMLQKRQQRDELNLAVLEAMTQNLKANNNNMKQILSPNFFIGRKGYTPKLVVIHIMDGTLLGTDEWFANPASKVSSHYGIGVDGDIHQYVLEENSAWTEGNVRNSTAKLLIKNVDPNYYCLSIENEGHDLSLAPDVQMNVLTQMILDLCTKYNIPIDRDHIIGHFEIDSVVKPNCPSPDHSIMDVIVKKVVSLQATNQNKFMIKWIKCYTTGSDIVNTYNVADNAVESVGETHSFTSAEDAVSKSTSEVLVVWDAKLVGVGSVSA